jgi:hypothetical protein
LDTSVIGGCFDSEFSKWSNALISDFRDEKFIPAGDFVRKIRDRHGMSLSFLGAISYVPGIPVFRVPSGLQSF